MTTTTDHLLAYYQVTNQSETNMTLSTDSDILSDSCFEILYFVLVVLITPATIVLGVSTNIVNLLVYHRLGLQDTVSVVFFSLSLTDLIYLLIHLASFLGNVSLFVKDNMGQAVSLASLQSLNFFFPYVMVWYASWPYDISVMTTVIISLQRCLCIALPFRFKSIFTRKRTIVIIASVYVYVTSSYVPIFTTYKLTSVMDPIRNVSVIVLDYDVMYGANKEEVFYWMNRILLQIVAQILIFINFLVLATCIARSAIFRRNLASGNYKKTVQSLKNAFSDSVQDTTANVTLTSAKISTSGALLSSKDLQVVKSVAFVALLFLLSNLPANILFCVNRFVPGFHAGGAYSKTFALTYMLRTEVEIVNASVNFFVYNRCNRKFHMAAVSLRNICGRRKERLDNQKVSDYTYSG